MPKNIGCNFYQIATQLTLIPVGKNGSHVFIIQLQKILHHPVGFGNQLHITVFDTIMYHFNEMSRAGRTNPVTARSTIGSTCSNTLQDGFYLIPGSNGTARHNRSTVQRSFFTARNTGTDKAETFRFGQCHTTVGIFIV